MALRRLIAAFALLPLLLACPPPAGAADPECAIREQVKQVLDQSRSEVGALRAQAGEGFGAVLERVRTEELARIERSSAEAAAALDDLARKREPIATAAEATEAELAVARARLSELAVDEAALARELSWVNRTFKKALSPQRRRHLKRWLARQRSASKLGFTEKALTDRLQRTSRELSETTDAIARYRQQAATSDQERAALDAISLVKAEAERTRLLAEADRIEKGLADAIRVRVHDWARTNVEAQITLDKVRDSVKAAICSADQCVTQAGHAIAGINSALGQVSHAQAAGTTETVLEAFTDKNSFAARMASANAEARIRQARSAAEAANARISELQARANELQRRLNAIPQRSAGSVTASNLGRIDTQALGFHTIDFVFDLTGVNTRFSNFLFSLSTSSSLSHVESDLSRAAQAVHSLQSDVSRANSEMSAALKTMGDQERQIVDLELDRIRRELGETF
jgi:hypothetical protein